MRDRTRSKVPGCAARLDFMLTTACSLLASASALVPGVTTQPMSQLLQHRVSPMEMRVHSMQPPPSDMAPRPPDDMYQVYLGTQGERPSEYVARVLMMVCDVSEDEAFAAAFGAQENGCVHIGTFEKELAEHTYYGMTKAGLQAVMRAESLEASEGAMEALLPRKTILTRTGLIDKARAKEEERSNVQTLNEGVQVR